MKFLDRGGVRLAWDEAGSGPPLLLIMGHRYSSAMWYPVFEGLGGTHHLMWFDNRGTGQSGAPKKTSIAEMAADALAVMDAAGVESAHVYGVSMGGGIALEFGIRYPERTRSLILGCTMAKTPEHNKRPPRWLSWLLYHLPMPVLKALGGKPKFNRGYGDAAPNGPIERDLKMLAKDPFSRDGVLAQHHAILDYNVPEAVVRAVDKPTLVLHGTQDLAVPYEQGKRLSELIPGARLVTFQDIGHNYFVGAGEQANAEVSAFIQEVEAGRARA